MQPTLSIIDSPSSVVRLGIIGIGGAGGHVLARLNYPLGAQLWYTDTDSRALQGHPSIAERLLMGAATTRGLSAGGDASVGKQAAESSRELFEEAFKNLDILLVFTGLSGGTGGGATPAIVEIAQKLGVFVLVFAFLPFSFEGLQRSAQAEAAIRELRSLSIAVVPLPNARLIENTAQDQTVLEAFAQADKWANIFLDILWCALTKPGYMPIDLAVLRRLFKLGGGKTLFGLGFGDGPDALQVALSDLCLCPLLHLPECTQQADRLLVMIRAGDALSMDLLRSLSQQIAEKFSASLDVAIGLILEPHWAQRLELCVLGISDIGQLLPNRLPSSSIEPSRSLPKHAPASRRQQDEFNFDISQQQRGFFEKTTPYKYNDEDLDIPTYLRKNIKLKL